MGAPVIGGFIDSAVGVVTGTAYGIIGAILGMIGGIF